MAEVVGLVASVAALAELTLKVFTNLYRYYVDLSLAPESSATLRHELGLTLGIVESLNETVKNDTPSLHSYHRSLEGAVAELIKMLEEMERRVGAEQTRGIRKLKWPFTKQENEQYLATIERYKGTINTAMNTEQLW